jgi:hypothetical protein
MWDDPKGKQRIVDVTNSDLNKSTVDYMAEIHDINLAMNHSAIPVEWIEEEDLTTAALAPYRVLYVTEPDVPAEGQTAIAEWVNSGGTLVTCSGAGTRDRYGQPSGILRDLSQVDEPARDRAIFDRTVRLDVVDKVRGQSGGSVAVYGVRGHMGSAGAVTVASFEDGSPALVKREVGTGRVFHFAFLPAVSYYRSQGTDETVPISRNTFDALLRSWITLPVKEAGVVPPVELDAPLVEAPVPETDEGWVISLINWADEPRQRVRVRACPDFQLGKAATVRNEDLSVQKTDLGAIDFSLPLDAIEVVRLYRA